MTGHVYKKKRSSSDGILKDEERVIMHDGDNSSSSGNSTDGDRNSNKTPTRSLSTVNRCRFTLDSWMHSIKFQILIVSLVICNCIIAVIGLLFELRIFEFSGTHSFISHLFNYANLTFLFLFVLEFVLKIAVWRLRFLKHRMECFDCIVVFLALALALAYLNQRPIVEGVGLLILLRSWRINEILKAMVESAKLEAERRVLKEKRNRRALERVVAKLREYCVEQECELQMYRVMLQQNNIPQPTVLRLPPVPQKLNVIAEVNEAIESDTETDAPPKYSKFAPSIEID